VNWARFFFIFIRHWYWFLISVGIALGIAFFKTRYTIPRYQASATLIIEEEDNSQDVIGQIRSVRYFRQQSEMANEKAKLKSFSTIKRTVDSLQQDVYWTGHGRIRIRPLYGNPYYRIVVYSDTVQWYKDKKWYVEQIDGERFRLFDDVVIDTILTFNIQNSIADWQFSISKYPQNPSHQTYCFVINNAVSLAKAYQKKLLIESDEREGSVLSLSSVGPVGEHEVDFLNTLCENYILSGLERKQLIAENTFTFIENQIEIILDSLSQAESQLLTFQISNNATNLSQQGEIAYNRLNTFHERRTQLKLQKNYYQYLQEYIDKRNDPETIIAPTLADENDRLLISTVQELQTLYEERESLDFTVMSNNPGLEAINDRIKGVRFRIQEIVRGLIENNRLIQEQLEIEENSILEQLKTLPINEQQLLSIKRKYDLYNQFYTYLLEKRAEAGIQKASTISNIRILDPARYDQVELVGKDKKVILLISFILGLIIPAGILILRDALDYRVRDLEDIVTKTDVPIIGNIGHAAKPGIIPAKDTISSSFSESLRRIRTNLSFALRDSNNKIILVTSSISGEGKTFSVANLAAIIAINHQKVLILGCDLRKPTLHRIFGISNEKGITSYLIGEANLQEIIIQSEIDNLFIIPSGPTPPNPAELIDTKEMKELLHELRKDYDYIIIDTPPIALVADALTLAKYADLTLYLVRQDYSHKNVLNIANQMKDEEKLPKPYLLINDIKPSKGLGMNYYYGYGKSYRYYDYSQKYYTTDE